MAETGRIRSAEDWNVGYSTYLLGYYLYGWGCGKLTSVDIDAANRETARFFCKDWCKYLNVVESDSVAYLRSRTEPIDVLFLDSLDADQPGRADHCLKEFPTAASKPPRADR